MSESIKKYKGYLELHADHALKHIKESGQDFDAKCWADAVKDEVHKFERDYGVKVYIFGRSGRHVCVEDTPENVARYQYLKRGAKTALARLVADFVDIQNFE